MNMVFNARTVIAWLIISIFVVVPRMLVYFGLQHPTLTDLTSLWATFVIILIAEIIMLWGYIKNIQTAIFAIGIAIVVAFILTSFFGA
jgi:hypothetical protein